MIRNAGEQSFHLRAVAVIRKIPLGQVATYGQIAALAGNHRASRAVVRVLHSSSKKEDLPWHRVVGGSGQISLKAGYGREEQRERLEREGVVFNEEDGIDLESFLWQPVL